MPIRINGGWMAVGAQSGLGADLSWERGNLRFYDPA